jgi:hypothetical protein
MKEENKEKEEISVIASQLRLQMVLVTIVNNLLDMPVGDSMNICVEGPNGKTVIWKKEYDSNPEKKVNPNPGK